MISPSDDVGCGNILIKLDVGRRDDRLVIVASFGWHREDRLLSIGGIGFAGRGWLGIAGIERRQVFRRIEVEDLRLVEGMRGNDRRTRGQQRDSVQRRDGQHVIAGGLGEAPPRQWLADEYVGPELRRAARDDRHLRSAPQDEVLEVVVESCAPRFDLRKEVQIAVRFDSRSQRSRRDAGL